MTENVFRRIRKHLGLTQTEAADRLGVTQPAISKIEKRDQPDFEAVEQLANSAGYEAELVIRRKRPLEE